MVSVASATSFFLCTTFLFQFSCSRSVEEKSKLELALIQGDVELATVLIKDGALQDLPGPKTLEKIYSKLRIVQLLLSNGIAVINVQENDLVKPSCKECEFDVLLIPGSSLVTHLRLNLTVIENWGNKTINGGRKPIHIICSLPDVSPSIVFMVLQYGNNDVNTRTHSGVTPLMLAADSGNLELVKSLIELGANINDAASVSFSGKELLEGHFAFAKLFSKQELKPVEFHLRYSALIVAIAHNNEEIINYFLSKGANIDNKGQSWLAIMHALYNGKQDIVEVLLRNRIDINSKDMLGTTALHKAAELGVVDIAKILVKNGASLNATDALGWTPLHVASFFSELGGKEMIKFLVQSGSSIQSLTYEGYSPLNLVEAGYNVKFLSFLVKNMDSLNEIKNYTSLPVEDSKKMHSDIVDSVIQLGASVNHQDGILGWSTLHWAAASGDLDAAKLLVKYGAAISCRSKMGKNPFEIAAYFGRMDVAKFLKTAKDLAK